ncbi:ABC transporter substrate-binding protein [Ruania halotolerans]|uniref:ABC transporter substrate-binding protein n=1 Tax=Ruania halotolerans TaxID=2897773 RepID=UPI001E3926B3|nr:extracellular solute-binding protein [Ruania halotolerans]UFU07811.1 extracellular solute-binding protein [Ruania halotolerans]
MIIPSRRTVLGASAAAAIAAALAGCNRSSAGSGSSEGATDSGVLQWWDHFEPLEGAIQGVFAAWAEDGGAQVERTVYNPNDMGEALQLALGSDQMPDVFSNLTGIPTPALVSRELISPVALNAEAQAAMEGLLVEGVSIFEGEVYSVPIFTHRQHSSLTWFVSEEVERAGGDPDAMTFSWEEFRRICREITAAGQMSGWVTNIAFDGRLEEHLIDLAQGAGQPLAFNTSGASSPEITDPRTGDYVFHGDGFVDALEFLQSLIADGVMLPASTSLDAKEARARWAAGEAAVFFDGPWNPGVLSGQFADFLPRISVANMPTPDGAGYSARGPATGQFWQSATSSHGEAVNELFSLLTTPDFALALAQNMDQPPADLSVVAEADVDPSYARAIDIYSQWCRLAPSPLARNSAVGSVIAEMEEIRPTLGEIVQGYLGGDIDDARVALTTYSDGLSAERDRAIETVTADGTEVSIDDWIFSDYQLGTDYDPEKY